MDLSILNLVFYIMFLHFIVIFMLCHYCNNKLHKLRIFLKKTNYKIKGKLSEFSKDKKNIGKLDIFYN